MGLITRGSQIMFLMLESMTLMIVMTIMMIMTKKSMNLAIMMTMMKMTRIESQ